MPITTIRLKINYADTLIPVRRCAGYHHIAFEQLPLKGSIDRQSIRPVLPTHFIKKQHIQPSPSTSAILPWTYSNNDIQQYRHRAITASFRICHLSQSPESLKHTSKPRQHSPRLTNRRLHRPRWWLRLGRCFRRQCGCFLVRWHDI